jgi:hypothetical protein
MGRANAKHGYLILNANTKSYSSWFYESWLLES